MSPAAACVPCFKRKMRCDRQAPCSNCQRRRDQSEPCHYPAATTAASVAALTQRVEKLEAYVRFLGVDPDKVVESEDPGTNLPKTPESLVEAVRAPVVVPKIVDRTASIWPGRYEWASKPPQRLPSPEGLSDDIHEPLPAPVPFAHFRPPRTVQYLAYEYPPAVIIRKLWNHYLKYIHSIDKLFFDWQKEPLIEKACEDTTSLSPSEHAFVLCLLELCVTTLTQDRCLELLSKDKVKASEDYRFLAEYALWDSNVASMATLQTLQAILMYMNSMKIKGVAGGAQSVIAAVAYRHAERLGLQHDGTEMNLSATETEERRRVWWQLQVLELQTALLTGCIAMNLYADWTTKRPGNYEDEDFKEGMLEYPPERVGITSSANGEFFYRMFDTGRTRGPDGRRLGLTWLRRTDVSSELRRKIYEDFSNAINEIILSRVEPWNPYHVLMQAHCGRAIVSFDWLMQFPYVDRGDTVIDDRAIFTMDDQARDSRFELSIKTFEYTAFMLNTPSLKDWAWFVQSGIMWPLVVYGLVDARHRIPGSVRLKRFWDSIDKIYEQEYSPFRTVTKPLFLAAGHLILDTWTVHVTDEQEASPPHFIVWLKENLPQSSRSARPAKKQQLDEDWSHMVPEDLMSNEAFLQDLANTDWSLWEAF